MIRLAERLKSGELIPKIMIRPIERIRNEDDVGGQARVTKDEERVLRGG